MKSYKIIGCAALLCLSLCACRNSTPADSVSEPPALTVPTTTAPVDPKAAEAVKTGREETFTYTDKSGGSHSTVYRIPALNDDTADARQLNAIISATYNDAFEAAEQAQKKQSAPALTSLTYDANVNDDIVSLVIKSEDRSHTVTYNVYNYDRGTGKNLDNESLLTYLQLDYEQTFQDLKASLEDDYYAKFKYESFPDDYYYQLENTVNDTAVKGSRLFLNENGELFAVCTEYASVGKGEFQVLLKV